MMKQNSDNNDFLKIIEILNDIKDQVVEYQQKIIQLFSQSIELITKQNQPNINNSSKHTNSSLKQILCSLPKNQKTFLLKQVKDDLTFLDYLYADSANPVGTKQYDYEKINSVKNVLLVENPNKEKQINNQQNKQTYDKNKIISKLLTDIKDEKLINSDDISFDIKINQNVETNKSNITVENQQEELIDIPFIELISKI